MSARASPDDLASVELARALDAELNGRASRASRPRARAPRADDDDGVAPSRAFRLHWPKQRVAVRSGGRPRTPDGATTTARRDGDETTARERARARKNAQSRACKRRRAERERDARSASGSTRAREDGDRRGKATRGAKKSGDAMADGGKADAARSDGGSKRMKKSATATTTATATVGEETPRRGRPPGKTRTTGTRVDVSAMDGDEATKSAPAPAKGGIGARAASPADCVADEPATPAPTTPIPDQSSAGSLAPKRKYTKKVVRTPKKGATKTPPSAQNEGVNAEKPRRERRPDSRFIKRRDAELAEFPPGMMVWVRLRSTHKGQWWPGRTWKLRQCANAYDLLDIKLEGDFALVKLFGSNCFEWASKEDLAPYDAQRQSSYREGMLLWYNESASRRKSRGGALKALRCADTAEVEDWSDPWSTSDASSSSDEESDAEATNKANVQALESMKVGLTPDWIVHGACKVFGLDLPTIEAPLIKGLLDPCTNSHLRPNIPAEKCYDKKDDGLKMSNPWAGYHVLVNPPYEAQVQWRFINRAINEVEWEHCPGIILVCRNSTDTSYFQRLLPFPRIHLRRKAVQFKDYSNCPIGFGICVFCIVSPTHPQQADIYSRFHDEFHAAGEFNIPVDGHFVKSPPFIELTTRLHRVACEDYRDSWIACDVCDRWREIPFDQMLKARKSKVWQCRDSFPMGCSTPLTKTEIAAFSVAKAETNTVLVASKVEGTKGPVGVYAAETRAGSSVEAADEQESLTTLDGALSNQNTRVVADSELREREERTNEFIQSGGKLHGLGCPCNWEPCRERRLKEQKILSKHFPGLRVEWEKMRDEITNVLTPFERERLEKIEANKNKMRSLMLSTEEQAKMTSHKVVHASAAESAALRMWEIAKRKHKTKTSNAERRERKVSSLKTQLAAAEKRLSDIMGEVREANVGVDTALKVLEAIRSRAKRVEREFDRNSARLKTVKDACRKSNSAANKSADAIWSDARARVPVRAADAAPP